MKTKAAGLALVLPDGRCLFLKRSPSIRPNPNKWCLPGGHCDKNEPPEVTAVREAREETGYIAHEDAAKPRLVDTVDGFATYRQEINSEFIPTLNAEHVGWAWAPLDDPPEPFHPGMEDTLMKLAKDADALPALVTSANSSVPLTAMKRNSAANRELKKNQPGKAKDDGEAVEELGEHKQTDLEQLKGYNGAAFDDWRKKAQDALVNEDMGPEDWRGLVGGLLEFFAEEARESEHAEDDEDAGGEYAEAMSHEAGDSDVDPIFDAMERLVLDFKDSQTPENSDQTEKAPDWTATNALAGEINEKPPLDQRGEDRQSEIDAGWGQETNIHKGEDCADRAAVYRVVHDAFGEEAERRFCKEHAVDWDAWTAWCREDRDQPPGPVGDDRLPEDLAAWDEAPWKIKHWMGQLEPLAMDKSIRTIDKDGRLHVDVTNICKACVSPYRGDEIPDAESLGLEPDRIYNLLRDPVELENAASTINGVPLLRKHIPVSADDHRPYDVVGAMGTSAEWDYPYIKNSLVVWPAADIEEIASSKKKELSPGYHYRPDMTAGSWNGQHYDGVMRDIVFNHVAIVEDGRQGPDVVIGDTADAVWDMIASEIESALAA